MLLNVLIGGNNIRLTLERDGSKWKCQLNDKRIQVQAETARPGVLSLFIGDQSFEIKRDTFEGKTRIWVGPEQYIVERYDPRSLKRGGRAGKNAGPTKLVASMPGKVLRVLVQAMQSVEIGQALVVVEAMKMQNEIKSPVKGIVSRVVPEAIQVNAGDLLAIVEPESPA